MENSALAQDYLRRSAIRLRALDVLFEAESWADTVRESQEIVELALKGLLRACGIAPPRLHDVSDVLFAEQDRLPREIVARLDWLASVSRRLRRDRELAFYGAEDLTPGSFYNVGDATAARADAQIVVALATAAVS